MKFLLLIVILFLSIINSKAQKPQLDTSAFNTWTSISQGKICNDGKYISYIINNDKTYDSKLVVKDDRTRLIAEYPNVFSSEFSEDSKFVLIKKNDTLIIQSLQNGQTQIIPSVTEFQTFSNPKGQWLIVHHTNQHLEYAPLENFRGKSIDKVTNFSLSPSGKILIVQKETRAKDTMIVEWIELLTGKSKVIHMGAKAQNYTFDKEEKQLAFYSESTVAKGGSEIFYYRISMDSAIRIVNNQTTGIGSDMEISNRDNSYASWGFSKDGQSLFFNLKERIPPKPKVTPAKVKIWAHQDKMLQSQQDNIYPGWAQYLCSYNLTNKKVIRLVNNGERIKSGIKKNWNDNYILIEKIEGDLNEWYWNDSAKQSTFLVSTLTGERTPIQIDRKEYLNSQQLSPDNKFAVYYDSASRNYFSYEISTGITRNLTHGISTNWLAIYSPDDVSNAIGITGWYEDEKTVIIEDRYDLWMLDPSDKRRPVNLTNNNKQSISIISSNWEPDKIFRNNDEVIIKNFNLNNYNHSLFKLKLRKKPILEKLTEGPYVFNEHKDFLYFSTSGSIQRAKDKNLYLIARESAHSSLNYYLTGDFAKFTRITDNHPENKWNWLTTELCNFKLKTGGNLNGILFKPDNFDPKKKYPVILQYYHVYETTILNAFPSPIPNGGTIDIPYMVSNGYLVFFLDIKYVKGKTGESALRSVLGAADYLSQKPWVDSTKLGINGHSYGGFETNYIITKTNRFAAALSAAAISDPIAHYSGVWGPGIGFSMQQMYEKGYLNMTGSLWESQDEYLENSPILKANRINTPLLMMHNPKDAAVAFSQGIEFFTALRRLKKTVWMLEYEGQEHTINDFDMRVDYCIRQKQFFDHYLKGLPMPHWMSRGIPRNLRGIDDGLKLDTLAN